ncbi:MAG: hypothetical protein ACJLS2_02385 [Microcella pacifica]
MTKRTPVQEMAHQMQKLKDMGVTISVTQAPGVLSSHPRPWQIIAQAAQEAGIYEQRGAAPELSAAERARVEAFGIHPELDEGGDTR